MNKSILALMLGAALWLPGCGSSGNFDAIANTGQNSAPPAPVEQQNGFSEMELLEPGAELEEGEVAMMFLEPPTGAEEMEPDSGPLGQDLVPVQIDSQQRLTLLLEPDTDELASAALRNSWDSAVRSTRTPSPARVIVWVALPSCIVIGVRR